MRKDHLPLYSRRELLLMTGGLLLTGCTDQRDGLRTIGLPDPTTAPEVKQVIQDIVTAPIIPPQPEILNFTGPLHLIRNSLPEYLLASTAESVKYGYPIPTFRRAISLTTASYQERMLITAKVQDGENEIEIIYASNSVLGIKFFPRGVHPQKRTVEIKQTNEKTVYDWEDIERGNIVGVFSGRDRITEWRLNRCAKLLQNPNKDLFVSKYGQEVLRTS